MKMKVLFLKDEHPTTIIAVFPEVKEHDENMISCFGDEGDDIIALDYCAGLQIATPDEYQPMLNQLQQEKGYKELVILNETYRSVPAFIESIVYSTMALCAGPQNDLGAFASRMILRGVIKQLQEQFENPVTHDNKN